MGKAFKSRSPEYVKRYQKLQRCGYRLSVDALGARRRLQALAAIGYTWNDLRNETVTPELPNGVGYSTLSQIANEYDHKSTYLRIDKAIRQAYDRLCGSPKDDTNARRVRSHAFRKGWAPPGAWDDIDNPNERPHGAQFRPGWRQNWQFDKKAS